MAILMNYTCECGTPNVASLVVNGRTIESTVAPRCSACGRGCGSIVRADICSRLAFGLYEAQVKKNGKVMESAENAERSIIETARDLYWGKGGRGSMRSYLRESKLAK